MRYEEVVHKRYEESIMDVQRKLRALSDALDRYYGCKRGIAGYTESTSKNNPAQPRNDQGQWTSGGGNSGSGDSNNSQDVFQPADKFSTSGKGVEFIKQIEIFRPQVYRDEGGKRTIGYGHRLQQGENFPNGVSEDEALKILAGDLETAEEPIKENVTVDLNQCQFDALTSLVFNIGGGNFGKSTLLRLLNRGDYNKAADEFPKWNKVTDKNTGIKRPSAGLTKRRKRERNLFLHGKYE